MVTSTNSLSLDLEWPADPSATNPEELFAAGYSACFNGKAPARLISAEKSGFDAAGNCAFGAQGRCS